MIARAAVAGAAADFRDRARRPAFLLVVLGAVALGYLAVPPVSANYAMVKVGAFRGVYDSDYVGVMLAMIGSLWLPMFGFYVIRNAIVRDTVSGVGALLAATPLRASGYLLGKYLSNLAVLAVMAGALALTAPAMQLIRGESTSVDLVALWLPFVLLCLPVLAVAAAGALVFESIRPLRGGIGNVVWFFAYPVLFIAGLSTVFGSVTAGFQADVAVQHPGANAEISVGVTGEEQGLGRFTWSGLEIDGVLVAVPLMVLILSTLVAMLPALWFTRFDPSRQVSRAAPATDAGGPASGPAGPAGPGASAAFAGTSRPRTAVVSGRPFRGLVAGELRVHLAGLSRWWWLGLQGLSAAALVAPSDGVGTVLLFAWIWPVLLWSRLGTHAFEQGVDPLLAGSRSFRGRLAAEWVAGVVIAALTGAGPLLRMLVTGDTAGAAAWSAGATLIPALALLLGSVSRSARLFQAVYLALWYGVLNGVAAVDVMGAVRAAGEPAGPNPLLWAAVATALITVTLIVQEARHARR